MSNANVVANDAAPGLTRLREIEAQFSEKISGTGVTDGNAFSALVANVPAANSAYSMRTPREASATTQFAPGISRLIGIVLRSES